MYLALQPTWAIRELTQEEIQIANTVYSVFQTIVGGKRSLARQVKYVAKRRGDQPIPTATGNIIDELFKKALDAATDRGELPKALHITRRGEKGPDLWLDRVAWDITTAEQGSYHVERDISLDEYRWDVYFVLGY